MFLPKQHPLVCPYAGNITQKNGLGQKKTFLTMPYPSIWKTERWITMSYQNESHLQFRTPVTHPRIATEMESVWRSDAWQEEGREGRDRHNVPRFKGAGGKLILIRSDVQELVHFWELHLFTSPWTERALCALRCLKQWAFMWGRQGTWVNLVTLDVFVYVTKRRGRDRMEEKTEKD